MLKPAWKKNDKRANILILSFSTLIFITIVILGRVKLNFSLGFDVHLFAKLNAFINSIVAVLLVIALIVVKRKNFLLHKNLMLSAIFLSFLFLLSYIFHHLLAGETRFGDINQDGLISGTEKTLAGNSRILYYILLGTHIPLAGIILPFILYSAYRALIGEYVKHKRLVRITWPVWFYVAVSGVIIYWMISPYYS